MSESMRALRLHGPNDLRLEQVPVPEPGPGQVLIAVHRCGICGTDLHLASGTFPTPSLPVTLGHEFSGTVAALGADPAPSPVTLATGTPVVADINTSCGRCYFCRRGQRLFCPYVAQLGVGADGGLADYVLAPVGNVYALPPELSLDAAAYVEPLACAVHGQDRVGLAVGDTVLVIGAGPMGLAHVALARLRGAARVIVSELDADRGKLAQQLGADVVLDPSTADLGEALAALTGGVGPDVVIEAVGTIPTYEAAVAQVRRGGTILAYGAAPATAEMRLRPFELYAKELTIVGSYAGTGDTWPRAIELLAGGRFDPSTIVDSVRPLEEAAAAIEGLRDDRSTVKVHIDL